MPISLLNRWWGSKNSPAGFYSRSTRQDRSARDPSDSAVPREQVHFVTQSTPPAHCRAAPAAARYFNTGSFPFFSMLMFWYGHHIPCCWRFSIPSAYTVLLFLFFVSQGSSGLEKKLPIKWKAWLLSFSVVCFKNVSNWFCFHTHAVQLKWGIIWYKLPAEQKQKN